MFNLFFLCACLAVFVISPEKALMWGALMPNGTVIAQPGFVTWVMSLLWRKQPKGDEL
jgi:hypothetical protein